MLIVIYKTVLRKVEYYIQIKLINDWCTVKVKLTLSQIED